MNIPPLIFFVYPAPKGSEENQFTAARRHGVNKLIFEPREYSHLKYYLKYLSFQLIHKEDLF